MSHLPKILVIVGPTASGKTSLGVALAKELNGEVVSADSRLLYRGMDIGTAKPTLEERQGIPHHLIDIAEPDQQLTLTEYQEQALAAIDDILKRGKLPIVLGGTGLYVRAIVDNFEVPKVPPNPKLRAQLESLSVEERLERLQKLDPTYAKRAGHNPRYVIRALEVIEATGQPFSKLQKQGSPRYDSLQIGLSVPPPILDERIAARIKGMVKAGLVEEVRKLPNTINAIGYRELLPYLRGEISLEKALTAVKIHTHQYAKRQMTWFKRDSRIQWIETPDKALELAKNWLKDA